MSKRVGRQPVRGNGRKELKHSRRAYSYAFKLAVTSHFREHTSIATTMAVFFPDVPDDVRNPKRKLVYKWLKQHDQIKSHAINSSRATQSRVRAPGVGTTLSPDAEATIVKWVNDYRCDAIPVSLTMLKMKAQQVAAGIGISSRSFTASWHWQRGFTRRHRLFFRTKTRQGQVTPVEAMEKAAAFAKDVAAKMSAEGICLIYNADQTGVNFELLPRRTLTSKGDKTVWVKCGKEEKERMTAMLLGASDGTKFPPFLVLRATPSRVEKTATVNRRERHGFGRNVWKKLQPLQDRLGVQIYGNKSAWWTGALTLEFLRFHFGHRGVFSESVMLLLGDFSGHWVDEVLSYATMLNIVLMKVPPGLTWLCQPVDAVWIKPFEDHLRNRWIEHLQEQLEDQRTQDSSSAFDMTAPDRDKVATWIKSAWDSIPESSIRAGFAKCLNRPCVHDAASYERDEPPDMQDAIDAVVTGLTTLHMVDTARNVANDDDVVDNPTYTNAQKKVASTCTPTFTPASAWLIVLGQNLPKVATQRPGRR